MRNAMINIAIATMILVLSRGETSLGCKKHQKNTARFESTWRYGEKHEPGDGWAYDESREKLNYRGGCPIC